MTNVDGYRNLSIYESAGDISNVEFTSTSTIPWYKDRENIKGVYIIDEIAPHYCAFWFRDCSSLKEIKDIHNLKTNNVISMSQMFRGCYGLIELNLGNFNTSNVTSMMVMFYDCKNLKKLNISSFDTKNVTDMMAMFYHCENLTNLDLSNFKTDNVSDYGMYGMFLGCRNLSSLDVSTFNTSKITCMNEMFENCTSLTSLNVSNFDTANVTEMACMFAGADVKDAGGQIEKIEKMNLKEIKGLENFDTKNVTSMEGMFQKCGELKELDLSSFDLTNVSNTRYMFLRCYELEKIYVGDKWKNGSPSISTDMFTYCNKLVGKNKTSYKDANVGDFSYARIDTESTPGYLSTKQLLKN